MRTEIMLTALKQDDLRVSIGLGEGVTVVNNTTSLVAPSFVLLLSDASARALADMLREVLDAKQILAKQAEGYQDVPQEAVHLYPDFEEVERGRNVA